METKEPRFALGKVVATPGAIDALDNSDLIEALGRHAVGDWGDCCEDDAAENEYSVSRHLRIFSVYHSARDQTKFWVITEADRSLTTVLLPSEY
jgi:hypothetical protein